MKNKDLIRFFKSETFFYIGFAYLFSISIRLIWLFMNNDNAEFFWNDQFMINTNDGYFWAEGARDIIAGFHQEFDGSPVNMAASWLTAIFYWITPFSLETVIFYLPALLSSLVVLPVILIGRSLGQLHVGFIAALLSSIAWSYYNRTMIGYFDTDMLNIVLPSFLLWSLILAFVTRKDRYLMFMALDIIAYRLWYPQSYSLEFAFFGLIILYVLIFERKSHYLIKLLTMLLLAMMGLPMVYRVVLVIAFFLVSQKNFYEKYFYHFLALALGLFLLTGGLDPIWNQLKGYIFRDSVTALDQGLSLHYFSVMQTVSEAGQIPFERFVNRISGDITIFVLSVIGFIYLIKEHKVMLLSLPLVGLGFLAYGIPGLISGGGLRFTIYAIVPLALGIAFLLVQIAQLISLKSENRKLLYGGMLLLGTAGILYPNIKHVVDYQARPVMIKSEVTTLDNLKKEAVREDYTLAWWDYGYPIRFYSDTKTLSDGGNHSGEINFPVSVALTQPQAVSAAMSRLTVESYERNFKEAKAAGEKGLVTKRKTTFMQQLFLDEKLQSNNALYEYLNKSPKLPKNTRDIYYYLPFKMLNIYPVVESFSSRDLLTGVEGKKGFLRAFPLRDSLDRFTLGRNLYFSKSDGRIHQGNRIQPIKSIIDASYGKDKKIRVRQQFVDMNSNLHMMILPSYRRILLLDDKALNSTYVQLFFLEQYDTRYFEPVIMSPYAKIYKLKI